MQYKAPKGRLIVEAKKTVNDEHDLGNGVKLIIDTDFEKGKYLISNAICYSSGVDDVQDGDRIYFYHNAILDKQQIPNTDLFWLKYTNDYVWGIKKQDEGEIIPYKDCVFVERERLPTQQGSIVTTLDEQFDPHKCTIIKSGSDLFKQGDKVWVKSFFYPTKVDNVDYTICLIEKIEAIYGE